MKCKKSERICKEWAKDFRQTGNAEEAGFWVSLSLAFSSGKMEAMGEGLEYAVKTVEESIHKHNEIRAFIAPMIGEEELKAIDDIHEERLFILPNLKQLQGV